MSNIGFSESTVKLEENGDQVRLLIHFDVSMLTPNNRLKMLRNALRILAIAEQSLIERSEEITIKFTNP